MDSSLLRTPIYGEQHETSSVSLVAAAFGLVFGVCAVLVFARLMWTRQREQLQREQSVEMFSRVLGISLEESRQMLNEAESKVPSLVAHRLYLGNSRASSDRDTLARLHVTHIINATSSLPIHFPGDFEYLRLPVEDNLGANIGDHLDRACDFIRGALTQRQGNVLVHCQQGVSRSATIVLAFLMVQHGHNFESALKHTLRSRWIKPNDSFKKQLLQWEERRCAAQDGAKAQNT